MSTLPSGPQAYHYRSTPPTIGLLDNFQEACNANHEHPQIELICLRTGSASVLIGSQLHQARPGDVFLIGSNLLHAIHPAPGVETDIISIHFTEDYFTDLFNLFKDFQPAAYLMNHAVRGLLWHDQREEIIPKVLKLRDAKGISAVIASMEVLAVLTSQKQYLILNQARFQPVLADEQPDDKIRKIFDYTQQHFREAITLAQIASLVNFTETSLCRHFKKYTGKSYYQYLNEVRIDKACTLLIADNSKSIEEVCYITGYSSPSTFYKHFKKILRMTPKEYQTTALTA